MFSAGERPLRSIGLRLTLWYFGVFVASTLVLFSAATLTIRSSMRARLNAVLTANLAEHRQAFESQGIEGLRKLVATPQYGHTPLYVRVLDSGNATMFEYRSTPEIAFDTPVGPSNGATTTLKNIRGRNDGSRWSIATTSLRGGFRLELALSDQATQETSAQLSKGLLIVWLGAIVLGLLGGYVLTRRALRPVAKLAATAQQVITSGDLTLRVPVRGTRDELDTLTALFNGVLERNETLVRGMREALDNVAHDLRTPLTRLRTGAEIALRDTASPERVRDALSDTIEESERVLAMLTTLMDISEAETGVMKLDRTRVDLVALLRHVLDLYGDVAAERGIRLITHIPAHAEVMGDRNRLYQAVANLVDNALKYTPVGGQVEIGVTPGSQATELEVRDSGVGISPGDVPRIWERLYRADRSRGEHGLGLGLSFVKAIVEAHGGEVGVRSEPGSGSTFTIVLPAAEEPLGSAS
ncbi:MAG: ATP-binding protein [Polyangia bacterium]